MFIKPTPTDENLNEVGETINERGKQYGDFTYQGQIAQEMKECFRRYKGWSQLYGHQREALDMIAHKIGRILNGNPHLRDSWIDIAGYAKLVADRCPK